MKIYILRHGETEWNKLKRIQGFSDIPLDEKGEDLARQTGKGLLRAGIHFDACVSSPLVRARRTAELVLAEADSFSESIQKTLGGSSASNLTKKTPLWTDSRIEEVNLGVWEGCCMIDDPRFPKADPGAFIFFKEPEQYRAPEGAESFEELIARTGAFLRDLLKKYREYEGKDFNLLVSTHGCASRALLMNIAPVPLKDYWRGQVPPNCSLSIAELQNGRWKLTDRDVLYA